LVSILEVFKCFARTVLGLDEGPVGVFSPSRKSFVGDVSISSV
jgi:hypothetical protein